MTRLVATRLRVALGTCLLVAFGAAISAPHASGAAQSPAPLPAQADPSPFAGDGMWIWYVSKAAGGNPDRIAAKARRRGVETVFVKAADGASTWAQFTPELVAALRARGLRVCAWHYVYGRDPVGEARASATAVARGADCLVIDAEAEYEGRYAQASTYVARLRRAIGPAHPLGLAAFPYVHYHPAFPYSVFLGPGGAEFNLPQMYWRAIGTSVDRVYATTYTYNRVYERPIFPLGQLYMNPPRREVRRFRRLALANGFAGVSWWSWQHATRRGWRAAGSRRLAAPRKYRPPTAYPVLRQGSAGDLVVWAQQHLAAGGYGLAIDGRYGPATRNAVASFQAAVGLAPTGTLDATTWQSLLASLDPQPVTWRIGQRAGAARSSGQTILPAPESAAIPALAYEFPLARR